MRNRIWMASLVAAALMTPQHVRASEPGDGSVEASENVRFDDLDLGSTAGIAALDERIDRAAGQVCRSALAAYLQGWENVRQCRAAARANARPQRQRALANARRTSEHRVGEARLAATPKF